VPLFPRPVPDKKYPATAFTKLLEAVEGLLSVRFTPPLTSRLLAGVRTVSVDIPPAITAYRMKVLHVVTGVAVCKKYVKAYPTPAAPNDVEGDLLAVLLVAGHPVGGKLYALQIANEVQPTVGRTVAYTDPVTGTTTNVVVNYLELFSVVPPNNRYYVLQAVDDLTPATLGYDQERMS
jgi:hypothetical protein